MQDIFIGVDVSMDWLDIHHLCRDPLCLGNRGGEQRIANGGRELTAFARRSARTGAWVIFEATGAMTGRCARRWNRPERGSRGSTRRGRATLPALSA